MINIVPQWHCLNRQDCSVICTLSSSLQIAIEMGLVKFIMGLRARLPVGGPDLLGRGVWVGVFHPGGHLLTLISVFAYMCLPHRSLAVRHQNLHITLGHLPQKGSCQPIAKSGCEVTIPAEKVNDYATGERRS